MMMTENMQKMSPKVGPFRDFSWLLTFWADVHQSSCGMVSIQYMEHIVMDNTSAKSLGD